ncbi:YciK family oxidoreductase [Hahella ganghwensis]|uniref:YciK family oxidoreductase n=1 Tax=Hahella ganghwensis TaxID=286420 RepID=UPI00035CBF48
MMYPYEAPEQLLKGRVILVTGSGAGIGRAAATTFARYGATIILTGRTTKKLEDVYDSIEAAGGPQPAIFPVNFEGAVAKDYDDLAQAIDDEFGRLDGLLHNASILGHRTPIEHYDPDSWAQVMQVNAHAPFLLTRSLLPVIRKSEDASIVFTSSSVGRKGRAYWGAYSVSKFATEGLMQVLADELDDEEHLIRVNSINPGATRTHMRAMAYPAEDPKKNPVPEDIMNVYLYLMGKDSIGVTGQAFDAQIKD